MPDDSTAPGVQPPGDSARGLIVVAQDHLNFWKSLTRHFLAGEEIQVVLDRRQGERRQRVEAVEQERRSADRRRPLSMDVVELTGFLGEGTQLKGELSFDGTVRVDGHLEGEIVRGDVLIIGEHGRVKAEIEVKILQVRGQLQGNVTAKQRVELLGPSQVTGMIRSPCLVIWKGAVFNGKCDMPNLQGNEVVGPER